MKTQPEMKSGLRGEPWNYVAGASLAMLVTPNLVQVYPAGQDFFLILAFCAFVGACEGLREPQWTGTMARTALGITAGLAVAVATLQSLVLGGALLGGSIVLSRWFADPQRITPARGLVVALIGGAGLWLIPPWTVFPGPQGLASVAPALIWGLCAGLAVMALEISVRWEKGQLVVGAPDG